MPGEREDREHLILCRDCGMAAVVPFKPLEKRQIFCRVCYRRRKEEERRYGASLNVDTRRNT